MLFFTLVMLSPFSNRTLTKTEVGTRDQGAAVMVQTMQLGGGMWPYGLWIVKVVEHLNWALISHTKRRV